MKFSPAVSSIVAFLPVNDRLATSGQPSEAQLAALAEEGFRTIINLGLHDDPRYSLEDEPGMVATLGMHYVHIPVSFVAPRAEDFEAFVAAYQAARAERTLIHCARNLRVSVFLALYRVLVDHWPRQAAEACMHDVWRPDRAWQNFFDEMIAHSHHKEAA